MNKIPLILRIVLSVAVAAALNNAFANEKEKARTSCKDIFIKMDANKDGKLSLAEFQKNTHPGDHAPTFKDLDSNKDGSITKDELCSGKGTGECYGYHDDAHRQARFKEMDADKNGKVTLKEYLAVKHHSDDPEKNFKSKDANKDGVLTMEEFSKCEQGQQGMHKGHGEGGPHHGDRFTEMDTNKDGKITLKEFTAVKHTRDNPEEVFKIHDTNKDGVLTKDEFGSGGHDQHKEQGKDK